MDWVYFCEIGALGEVIVLSPVEGAAMVRLKHCPYMWV